MTKLTAANSPLLHVVKGEFNARIFKSASKIANIDGEAAVVDFLMNSYHEDKQARARKRYTALIAGNSELLDTIRDWFGADLFRIAALEYAKDGETAAIDTVCGARCHSSEESARLRGLLEKFMKPAARQWGEYNIGEKLIVSPAYNPDTSYDTNPLPTFEPGQLVTVYEIHEAYILVGTSSSVSDQLFINREMMPRWFDREIWDTRPIEGPLSFNDLAYFRLIAQAESHGSPLEFRDFAELKALEAIGFVEVIDSDYYPLVLVTDAGLAYLADYTIVPLYSAAPDNEFCIGPLSSWELSQLRGVAANESNGTPTHYRLRHFGYLEDCGFIEYVPRLVWLGSVTTLAGGYIVTEAGLAELADFNTYQVTPTDPISDTARGRVVMAQECSYWRGLYGDPGPFTELFDELCYWRKTRGMPPINAVPALDKLINDQIDFNPPLAAQLGLERR